MPNSTNLVGVNYARRTTTKEFNLGTPSLSDDNKTWVYVVANVAVNAAQAPTVSAAFAITAATGGTYTADTAFAVGEYGWVRKTTSPL